MTTIRQRARLLAVWAAVAGAGLLALAQHGLRQRERQHAAASRAEQAAAEARAADLAKELAGAKEQAGELEARLKGAHGVGPEIRDRLEAIGKETASRDQATQAVLGQLQARLDEALRGKELASQLAALEQKLKEKETAAAATAQAQQQLLVRIERQERELESLRAEMERQAGARARLQGVAERPAPAVPVVTSVDHLDAAADVVIVGAGKKGGLDAGHTLWVSRDGKPIGRLRVIKVQEDMAGAEIIETTPGEQIQLSDRAATRSETPPGAADGSQAEPRQPLEVPLGKAPPPPPPLPEFLAR